jgi:hypothetical protein
MSRANAKRGNANNATRSAASAGFGLSAASGVAPPPLVSRKAAPPLLRAAFFSALPLAALFYLFAHPDLPNPRPLPLMGEAQERSRPQPSDAQPPAPPQALPPMAREGAPRLVDAQAALRASFDSSLSAWSAPDPGASVINGSAANASLAAALVALSASQPALLSTLSRDELAEWERQALLSVSASGFAAPSGNEPAFTAPWAPGAAFVVQRVSPAGWGLKIQWASARQCEEGRAAIAQIPSTPSFAGSMFSVDGSALCSPSAHGAPAPMFVAFPGARWGVPAAAGSPGAAPLAAAGSDAGPAAPAPDAKPLAPAKLDLFWPPLPADASALAQPRAGDLSAPHPMAWEALGPLFSAAGDARDAIEAAQVSPASARGQNASSSIADSAALSAAWFASLRKAGALSGPLPAIWVGVTDRAVPYARLAASPGSPIFLRRSDALGWGLEAQAAPSECEALLAVLSGFSNNQARVLAGPSQPAQAPAAQAGSSAAGCAAAQPTWLFAPLPAKAKPAAAVSERPSPPTEQPAAQSAAEPEASSLANAPRAPAASPQQKTQPAPAPQQPKTANPGSLWLAPATAAQAPALSAAVPTPPPLYWPGEKAAAFPRELYDDEVATDSSADQAARREHAASRLRWIARENANRGGPLPSAWINATASKS